MSPPPCPPPKGEGSKQASHVFITGTDTDVGKTWVTASLAKASLDTGQRVAIYKPIQTGVTRFEQGDAYACAKLLGLDLLDSGRLHVETTYCFTPPAAPSMIEGHDIINLQAIIDRYRTLQASYDVVLVEGAGGVMCPIKDDLYMVELAVMLELPAILVTRVNLGTLNHTVMSARLLQQHGVAIEAIIVKEAQPLSDIEKASLAVRGAVAELRRLLPDCRFIEQGYGDVLEPLVV